MRTKALLLLPALLACSGGSAAPVERDAATADASPPTDLTPLTDAPVKDSGTSPTPTGDCNEDGWCWVHPLPQGNTLLAVWGAAADDVWAVGDRGAIVHWNGQRWSSVASPTREFLRCVWGSGPSDVWAAGDHAVLHWDGQRWTMVKDAVITSIHGSAPDNVWFAWASTYLHWNGRDLKEGAHSNEGNNGYYNLALWAESPTRVWSVGYPATIEVGQVSGREISFDIVHSIEGTARLNAVWGTGTELWIVNETGGVYHRAGGQLTAIPTGVDADVSLNAVWGSVPGDIWVAGDKGTILRGGSAGFLRQPVPTEQPLYGLWGSGRDDVWAVGYGGMIIHWDGQRWSTPGRVTEGDLTAVWAAGPDDVWAVGKKGTIMRASGGTVSLLQSGTTKDLHGVWGSGPGDVWIGGDGVALRYSGGQLTPAAALPASSYLHVRGTGPDDVWMIAPSGTQHFDGQSWTPVDPGMPVVDLWPLNKDEVWATADKKALRWTRSSGKWTTFPVDAYQSIWGAAPDYVWVGGLEGLQRFDGMTFLPLERPETEGFVALWGVGRDDFWGVGGLGMITHRAGDHWEHRDQKSRATWNSFTGVWGSGPDATWVVGDGGTLMRRRR